MIEGKQVTGQSRQTPIMWSCELDEPSLDRVYLGNQAAQFSVALAQHAGRSLWMISSR